MHADTTCDPPERNSELLRQSLDLLKRAIRDDPRRVPRKDLRVLVTVQSILLDDENHASRQIISERSGLSEEELTASLRRLRKNGYLRPLAAEDFELTPVDPRDEPVRVSELQRLARLGELRLRAFGEEHVFAHGRPYFGDDTKWAIEMLPRILTNGFCSLYKDDRGFFLGPRNPALIDDDPFAAFPFEETTDE